MSDEYEGNKRREMRWEQMRGTPLPKSTDEVWKERHLLQDQYITELENRLRALWDKYDGDSKYYMARIKRLESVENSHADVLKAIDNWMQQHKTKEAKP